MKHLRHALMFGIIIGTSAAMFLISPLGRYIEDEFGLALLFRTRGAQPAPDDVVIINVDEKSAEQLNLPRKIENWPRDVYAELVTALSDLGAAVIVFDIHFGDAQNEANDRTFGDAMRENGTVILYQKMVRKIAAPATRQGHQKITAVIDIEQEIPPIQVLADAALASVSFPIPKMPVRVNQAWTFKTSAGDMPTLPVVALQALALERYEAFYRYVKEITGSTMESIPETAAHVTGQTGIIETMHRYRRLLAADSENASHSSPPPAVDHSPETRLFQALVQAYRGDNNRYINFYGPAATLKTHSLANVFSGDSDDTELLRSELENKVVFVGAARTSWSEQKDGFYTVYTRADGLDLSGVEIAATVYANLLDDRHLKAPPLTITVPLLLCSAIIFAVAAFALNPAAAAAALVGIISCFFIASIQVFAVHAIRLPVITWIILMPPAIFFSAIVFKFIRVRRERTHIKQALHMYLPDNVVEEISNDLSFVKTGDRMVYGVCLTTDAQHYTTLSEKLDPLQLSSLMKDYFAMMYKSVSDYDGLICNVIGDSMFAMWPSTNPDRAGKRKACRAALDIVETIEAFNQKSPERALPTRIGLHSGYLLMGNIGAEGHYEYAPVGDIVNTASRIENVNKKLGTWILASEETVSGGSERTRLLGSFLMSGKSLPVTLHQLLPREISSADKLRLYDGAFPTALEIFASRRWQQAEAAFRKCLELQPDDGPSQFYLKLCIAYRQSPPDDSWEGFISLDK